MDYRIHLHSLRNMLGCGQKIPADFSKETWMLLPASRIILGQDGKTWVRPYLPGAWKVIVKPTGPVTNGWKSSKHRIYVQCQCGREIPAGRLDQHAESCDKIAIV